MINTKTISQAQKIRSVTQKVALQINCKLGGELWALQIPMVRVFFDVLWKYVLWDYLSEHFYKKLRGEDNCATLAEYIL